MCNEAGEKEKKKRREAEKKEEAKKKNLWQNTKIYKAAMKRYFQEMKLYIVVVVVYLHFVILHFLPFSLSLSILCIVFHKMTIYKAIKWKKY